MIRSHAVPTELILQVLIEGYLISPVLVHQLAIGLKSIEHDFLRILKSQYCKQCHVSSVGKAWEWKHSNFFALMYFAPHYEAI